MWLTEAPGLPICITARRRYGARMRASSRGARDGGRVCARVLAVGRDRGDVPLHRGVDGRAVLRREQVEQEAPRDRDPEARLGPGLGLVAALRDRDPGERLDPEVNDAVEDGQGVGVAPERLGVDLEEQAL